MTCWPTWSFTPTTGPRSARPIPLERLIGEIKRRTDVVGISPNEAAIVRLVDALLLEQNDGWAVGRRYLSLETQAARRGRLTPAAPAGDPRASSYTTPRDTTPVCPCASEHPSSAPPFHRR
jgi:Transposase, Mutator family